MGAGATVVAPTAVDGSSTSTAAATPFASSSPSSTLVTTSGSAVDAFLREVFAGFAAVRPMTTVSPE